MGAEFLLKFYDKFLAREMLKHMNNVFNLYTLIFYAFKFMHLIFSNLYYNKTESIIIYSKTEINLINPLSI